MTPNYSLLAEGAVLYLLIGAGCGVALVLRSRGPRHPADVALLLVVWPLYAPFLLASAAAAPPPGQGSDFLEALQRAAGTPLGALLPSPEIAAGLNARRCGRAACSGDRAAPRTAGLQ